MMQCLVLVRQQWVGLVSFAPMLDRGLSLRFNRYDQISNQLPGTLHIEVFIFSVSSC